MIVWVNVLLLLTVTDVSTTHAVVIFRIKVSCILSVDGIKLWLLTFRNGQLSYGVIGHLSVKLRCYWLKRLSNVIGAF